MIDPFQKTILMALQPGAMGKHVYAGTVPEAEIARRRAKNRIARASRKINRKRR